MGKANREVLDVLYFDRSQVLLKRKVGRSFMFPEVDGTKETWVLLFLTTQVEVDNDLWYAQTRSNAQK